MLNTKQKQAVRNAVTTNKVTFRKDGTVMFKRGYFYRHGASAEGFAASTAQRLEHSGFNVTNIESRDAWAAWPKTSYFIATMKVVARNTEAAM